MIGQWVINEQAVNEQLTDYSPTENASLSGGRFGVEIGRGALLQRGWLRPDPIVLRQRTAGLFPGSTIELVSASGALVGKLRTDVQNSIVISCEFDWNKRGGCMTFSLKLNALPAFKIIPYSIVKIKIADTDFYWFSGTVMTVPDENAEKTVYEFKGVGLVEYLKGLNAFTVIENGQDIADIARYIVQNWVVPYCPIRYNASKISESTGVINGADYDFGKYTLDKIFDTLADMGGCFWGVDGDGELYFIKKTDTYLKTKFIGFDMLTFSPQLDMQNVINTVVIARTESLGSGGVGWAVAYVGSNESSIGKYGKRELQQPYQVPGYFSDADCKIIGDNLIAEKSEPKYSAKATGFPIQSESDFWTVGNYRFIMPFGQYITIYDDMDSVDDWAGSATVTEDTNEIVYGSASIKAEWSAANQTAILTKNFRAGKIMKIRVFVKSEVTGRIGKFGCGLTNYNENMIDVDIPVDGAFFPFEWDVSSLNLRQINKFGFLASTSSGAVWLDRLDIECKGHAFYKLEFSRCKYTLSPGKIQADPEFGTLPNRMEDYFASLISASKELKYTQEIR